MKNPHVTFTIRDFSEFAYSRERNPRVLGSGAYGTVYLGYMYGDRARRVAIKELRRRQVDSGVVEDWVREGELGRELDHPNIAEVYHFDQELNNGTLRMSMEYVPNGEFFNLITSNVRLPARYIRFFLK